MKIETELQVDLEIKGIKKYGESKTRMATVLLKTKVHEQDAVDKFGEEFHRIAFGQMTVDDGVSVFPWEQLSKPRLVCEDHAITILGHEIRAVPEIPKIKPVESEAAVVVELLLPLPCDVPQAQMIGDLAVNCGETITAEFNPVQMSLPGTVPLKIVKKKDGKFGNQIPF
jgi:hypothetical protein